MEAKERGKKELSDSKIFTNNSMPKGYSDVWKAFAKAWLNKHEDS